MMKKRLFLAVLLVGLLASASVVSAQTTVSSIPVYPAGYQYPATAVQSNTANTAVLQQSILRSISQKIQQLQQAVQNLQVQQSQAVTTAPSAASAPITVSSEAVDAVLNEFNELVSRGYATGGEVLANCTVEPSQEGIFEACMCNVNGSTGKVLRSPSNCNVSYQTNIFPHPGWVWRRPHGAPRPLSAIVFTRLGPTTRPSY